MITMPKTASPATITGPRRWNGRTSTVPSTGASRRGSPNAWPGGRNDVPKRANRIAAALLVVGLLATPAAAQDRYTRALAAGYKASFLCSDLFNAGQSVDQVEADDLKRTYSEL